MNAPSTKGEYSRNILTQQEGRATYARALTKLEAKSAPAASIARDHRKSKGKKNLARAR